MPAKLCISLVLALLVLALAGGNPFLRSPAHDVSNDVSFGRPTPVPLVAGSGPVADTGLVRLVDRDFVDDTRDDLDAKFVQSEECPDPVLRCQVVAARHDASGRSVWLLHDGRTVRRNPAHDPRRPDIQPLLLVETPAAGASDTAAFGSAPPAALPRQR